MPYSTFPPNFEEVKIYNRKALYKKASNTTSVKSAGAKKNGQLFTFF